MNTIAVDFDGTLNMKHNFPELGEPRMWLIEMLISYRASGGKLILWTCREDVKPGEYANFSEGTYLTDAVEWCRSYGLEFDAVNMNIAEIKYPGIRTSRKIMADLYIDDKAALLNDSIRTLKYATPNSSIIDVYFN